MNTITNPNYIILIILTLIISFANSTDDINNKRFCTVDNINIKIKYPKIKNNTKIIKRNLDIINNNNNEDYKPIQIYVDTTYLSYQNNNTPSLDNLYTIIIKAFDKCVYTLNKLIKVLPLDNKINFITEEDLNEWNFDPNYVDPNIKEGGEGISTDLLILPIFSMNDNISFEYMEGYPVYFNELNNRPIIGIININGKIALNLDNIDYLLQSILLHELTHILGFLVSLFKFYPGGEQNTILYKEESRTNVQKGYIITPKVVQYARKYFNCSSLEGIELERSTSNQIADSHWEARLLLGEYMNSEIYTPEQVISEFTLALLEDSGWYKVNYYTGGLMRFGKNQGCYFIEKDCYKFDYDKLGNEFFSFLDAFQPSCSSGRQSRTYFMLKISESFTLYNYNRNTKYVGRKSADYCWVNDFSEKEEKKMLYVGSCRRGGGYYGEEVYFKEYNTYPSSSFPEEFGEVYSNNSFCALSSVYPIGKNEEEMNNNFNIFDNIIHSLCYPMYCTNSSLTIQIYNHFVVCPRSGGKVSIGGDYTGYLFCPDYNLICSGTKMCNDMFDCVEKESVLKESSYEYDYISKTHQSIGMIKDQDILINYEKENNGVCPKYCSKCKTYKKCYKCENNKVLIGKHKNDLLPITCNETSDITEKHYLDEEDNVYYECGKGCASCQNENNCITCLEGYVKNTYSQCEEIIENCDKYNIDFTECVKCKNNSYIIGDNHKKCNKEINIDKYYTEDGISYNKCDEVIENCYKCLNKSHCIKCEDNYYLIGKDKTKCYEENTIDKNKYILEDNGTSYYLCSDIINNCEKCRNSTFCEKCEDGHVIVKDNRNKESCKDKTDIDENKNYYYSENNESRLVYHLCNDSINQCEQCLNKDNCIKCEDNYILIKNISNSICYKENEIENEKDKYYIEEDNNNNIIYYPCDTNIHNCDKCNNKTNCIKCKENNYFIGNDRTKCYNDEDNEIKKEEYYSEDNGISYYKCDIVIENCKKCLNKSYCIKCNDEYYLIGEDNSKCYNKNDIDNKKYFIDDDGISLMLCNSSIANCDECFNKTICDKCSDNYTIINNDKTKCINELNMKKEQYYTEDNGITYYSCDTSIPNCEKCKNKTYCIKCKEEYFLIENDRTKCIKEEEDNHEINKEEYFTENNGTSYIKCDEVIENCNKCLNKSYCIKCNNEYYLVGEEKNKCIEHNKIIEEDKNKYYMDENNTVIYLCNTSLINCEECTNKSYCTKCKDNYFFIGEDKTKCLNESELVKENKYYLDDITNKYYPCDTEIINCDKCLNKSYCIKCKDNYFLLGDERIKCYNEKEEQKYFTEDNGTSYYQCDTFIPNCEQCLNKSFCIKCVPPFYILGNNHNNCTQTSNLSQYYTEDGGITYNLCNNSIHNCKECHNSTYCVKCEDNYFFINNNRNKCVKVDENNEKKYIFDNISNIYYSCNNSIPGCDECSGKNECIKCNDNYYFIGEDRTKCNNDINIKIYYTEDNGTSYYPCNNAIQNCNECTKKTNCNKCNEGYYLMEEDKNKCYNDTEKIINYYTNDNGTTYKLCNTSINHCEKCIDELHCIKCEDNYILIKNISNSKCYKENEIENEKDKYYIEEDNNNNIIYYPCDTNIHNCDKCNNKTNCIKCKENNYFIGNDRTKCYNDEDNEIKKEEYYSEDNGISYYKCDIVIENCKKCLNKSYCIKCNDEYYLIGEDNSKCYNKNDIDNKKYFINDDNSTFIPCNKSISFCQECQDKEKCIKCNDGYYYIHNDSNTCRDEIDVKKYYTEDEGKTYYSCEKEIKNCEECLNKNFCTKCKNNYHLSNDYSLCLASSDISQFCTIVTEEINSPDIFDLPLIEQYITSYILDINKDNNNYIVHHLINSYYNYSILIFKSSICTYSSIKKGYYYLNTDNIMNKLLEKSETNNDNVNNDYIFSFINYNEKSNLLLFDQNDKKVVDINGECPECLDIMFDINNNYTSIVKNKLGDLILNKIVLNDFDIFDVNDKVFNNICINFTIAGIDMPINLRLEKIFLGLETEKIICTDNSCIYNNKTLSNFTGVCQCKINSNSLEYLLNDYEKDLDINYESYINTSKIKDSLNVFTCVNEGFNKNSFKNPGFNICLIMILIQMIFFVFYIIFKNNVVQLNLISNPPPKLIIHQDSLKDNKKENEINLNSINDEDEEDFLDKDYFTIDYPGQNISDNTAFKKWYSFQSEKIKTENEIRINNNKRETSEYLVKEEEMSKSSINYLFITMCKNCQCYTRHSITSQSVFAKCLKCEKEFCVGCAMEKYSSDNTKLCFMGYFKSLYLRMSIGDYNGKDLDIMEYIFLFFITIIIMPIYLALISCVSYLNRHPNKPFVVNEDEDENDIKINKYMEIYKVIYPIFFSLLYFVYIIYFFPFLLITTSIIFSIQKLRNKFLIIYEPLIGSI